MKTYRMFICFALLPLMALTACGDGYKKSADGVTYESWNEGTGSKSIAIEGADPATFKVLVGAYGVDKAHVYLRGRNIEGADPSTFKVIDEFYAYDQARVYFNGMPITAATPTGFSVLGSGWSKDVEHVFYANQPFQACDPKSFRRLSVTWAVDSQCVYYNQHVVTDADPSTFVVLNDGLGKDRGHVYASGGVLIEGADAGSFTLVGSVCSACARDKNRCYLDRHVVACGNLRMPDK